MPALRKCAARCDRQGPYLRRRRRCRRPTQSHRFAISLMKLIFVARNALLAYLIVSALDHVGANDAGTPGPPTRTDAPTSGAYTCRHPVGVDLRHSPRRARSGQGSKKSANRLPLAQELRVRHVPDLGAGVRKVAIDQGLPRSWGTVDFMTIVIGRTAALVIDVTTARTYERSAAPMGAIGVPTATNVTSERSDGQPSSGDTKDSRPCSELRARRDSIPGSWIGLVPARNSAIFCGSMSTHVTWCPSSARANGLYKPHVADSDDGDVAHPTPDSSDVWPASPFVRAKS